MGTNQSFLIGSSIRINATLSNSSGSINNLDFACFLNLSNEPEMIPLNYVDGKFMVQHLLSSPVPNSTYSVYCNSSNDEIRSSSITYTVYPEVLPIRILTISDEQVLSYELIPQALYVKLQNISTSEYISADYCIARIRGEEFVLNPTDIDGEEMYVNTPVAVERFRGRLRISRGNGFAA